MTFIHRPILMTASGAVVSGHHKASEAGAAVLRAGGNAMDAAIAASAALAVSVPHMNGIGGDCIALHFEAESGKTTVINGSGRAPALATPEAIRAAGHEAMPRRGPWSISVPGLVDAWEQALARFGTLPLGDLIAPAIRLATEGVPIDGTLYTFLSGSEYADLASSFPDLASIYGPPGSHLFGNRLKNPALAVSLEAIAAAGAHAMYRGPVGAQLLADLAEAGALVSASDLDNHCTRFDHPLTVDYLGRRLHAAPPNAQGIALSILSGLSDLAARRTGAPQPFCPAEYLARLSIAFAYRNTTAGDPDRVARPDGLLTEASLAQLAAGNPPPKQALCLPTGDTSTLVVIDRWGNAVSWVQSLFEAFGSGIASPKTGIVMHNRLRLQTLNTESPFSLRPSERPFHTLCPAIVEANGTCEVAIATPGDYGQPQIIHQVLTQIFSENKTVQAAIEAPRIRHDAGIEVMIEDRAPPEWFGEIEAAGYQAVRVGDWSRLMGGVNAILRRSDGLLLTGADPRRSSYALTAD